MAVGSVAGSYHRSLAAAGAGQIFFLREKEIGACCLVARRKGVNLLKESMDPVSVGLLVMGISTTSVTEANRLEAAQPVLDEAHLISVEKPAGQKEAPSYFKVGTVSW